MDGGGRSAGPGRGSRLKSVARALLGQSRPAASSKSKAREGIVAPERKSRTLFMLERLTPRGAGAAATLLILGGSAVFGAIKGGHVQEMATALRDTRDALANSAGFRIASITINGRKQLSQDEVLAIGGITGKRSLLFLDAGDVRDRLKANSWIADATVLKLYPDKLAIDITERIAFALWQDEKHVSVIAEDGAVLEPFVARRFTSLPLVVGKGAETHARDFLNVVAAVSADSGCGEGDRVRRRAPLESPAGERARCAASGDRRHCRARPAEQARSGRASVVARHRRDRPASARSHHRQNSPMRPHRRGPMR